MGFPLPGEAGAYACGPLLPTEPHSVVPSAQTVPDDFTLGQMKHAGTLNTAFTPTR